MKRGVSHMLKWILGAIAAVTMATAATAQSDGYRIRVGDSLNIEVLEDSSLNRSLLVLPDGRISFPLAGDVMAAGLTVSQLKAALTGALASNFTSPPSVFVAVSSVSKAAASSGGGGTRPMDVYLMGEVAKPGSYEVPRGTTVLQFLANSGGFSKFAAKKRLQLRRTDPRTGETKIYMIDYKAIEAGAIEAYATAPLADGDVIVVPERRLFE